VFVALGMQHALREQHIVICGLSGCTIFFPHYLIKGTGFEKKVTEHKMCVLIFSTNFVWNISHSKKNWARYDQNCTLVFAQGNHHFLPILMKLVFPRQIIEKYKNIKLSLKSVQWERIDRRTDMTKTIVAFRNLANEPTKKK